MEKNILCPILVAPPPFADLFPSVGEGLILSGTGPADAASRLSATTNLRLPPSNRTATGTGVSSGGALDFTDTPAANCPLRFSQVVTP
jgi:hypothetical protein